MKNSSMHFSMKWKLIISFSVIAIIFMAVAFYQSHKINMVHSSMERQKTEMEKRITVSRMTQFLQELNREETSLAESSDLELVDFFRDKQQQFETDLTAVTFEAGTVAYENLDLLHNQAKEYFGYFDELVQTMEDDSMDPLEVLEKIDATHTKSLALNQEMLKTNEQLYNSAAGNARQAQDDSFTILSDTTSMTTYAAILVFCFTIIIAIMLIRSFLAPVHKLQEALRKISEGDLRHQINSPYNDELGKLSHHFDHMVERVRDMLQQTHSVASSLAVYSHSFQQASSITAHTNHDIVSTIQEISGGADQQAVQSEQSSNLILELEQGVNEITEYTEVMVLTSQTANDNSRKGSAAVTSLQKVSEHSRVSIGKVYEALTVLSEQSKEISKITNSITEISNQTNVLSLNAAIEAALAGAYGKGFTVIATEVRKLSMQTKESSLYIGNMINEWQTSMVELQQYMMETKENLEVQDAKIAETHLSFEAIDQSIEEISRQIEQIHDKVNVTRTNNSRLAESVHCVASIAEETAAGVQEVNASSIQQDNAIRNIAQQAVEINEISQKLFQEINLFKINEDVVEEDMVSVVDVSE
ncbi:methyl-accepting chemotaxis protein [Paenibacillus segetis]|uniref:Methyl-accepting chemotaxis protein n=1 Tax=Paenibacillus segetis TaxID=1325360 RepID=A0ABQ1Y7D9_9BACL|nr:methyl-accepting chemotaxis protein [Paenibacillus segetis]GGH15327.1 hypothetical protein GCM10008013_09460 [Paenibacillus segetis]